MKWINTKDRLPKFDRVVIVCYRKDYNGSPIFAWGSRVDDANGWLWGLVDNRYGVEPDDGKHANADDDYQVTHWMPLPRPPFKKPKAPMAP